MTEELKAKIQKLILEENYEEAIKLCDEAIEKDDKDEDAYFNMAFAKINLQRYKEAIEGYSKVIELNNKNEIAYINRSVC
ncbi:tetratricopeptide repeat protein, partial [Brachyspira sp. G79]